MSFTFPLLLGGLVAIGVPVLVHLLLRQKPKTVLFPAFRFLIKRHKTNLTKLRLRHILLLALRMLLFALIVLALAQPKVKDHPWSLPTDQAVAAVFVFDTSASMDYTLGLNQNRLKEAQKRAVELLKLLPASSEIVLLDTAESAPIGNNDWLSREKAAERINLLRVQPANSPVTTRLAAALRLLAKVASTRDDSDRGQRARVLCVFSDRTKAAWDALEREDLQALGNQVPPAFDRLEAVRGLIAEQLELLLALRQKLPLPSAADMPEQVLADRLQKLQERIPQLRAADYPDAETTGLLTAARAKQQELLAILEKTGDELAEEARTYRDRLQTVMRDSLRNSAGFTSFYIDVGIDQPTDLALLDLQLLRDVSGRGQVRHKLQVDLQATGDDFHPTLIGTVDGSELDTVAIDIKPGKRETLSFELKEDYLKPGLHQAKVYLKSNDNLAINNGRYLTYAVRRVLLLTDPENMAEAELWKKAIEANQFGAALYRCEIASPGNYRPPMEDYDAVFLCSLKAPDDKLWVALREYVLKGNGVGVLPPAKINAAAYNDSAVAQELLPARFVGNEPVAAKPLEPEPDWNWAQEIYQHPFMHIFLEWKQSVPPYDIFSLPRGAHFYWELAPRPAQSQVLVSYADDKNRPAIVERVLDRKKGRPGHVLMLTTPPGWAGWNNYREAGHSFYVVLAGRTAAYLTGDLDRPALNFLSSPGGVLVPVPVSPQANSYKLYREAGAQTPTFVTPVTAEANFNEARVQQAGDPGNYHLQIGETQSEKVSKFSVNLPAEESDLSRTPKAEIEAVLSHEAVLSLEARTDLNEAMRGHISQPWELFPILMVILLVVLAVENLLANRFYRRERQEGLP